MGPELEAFVGEGRVCEQLAWALRRGEEVERGYLGCRPERIFDLASLTKVLGTASAFALLIDRAALRLSDPIGRWLPEAPESLAVQPLKVLLQHRAGLAAWMDLGAGLAGSPEGRLRELRRRALEAPLAYPPEAKTLYSDLGFILAAWVAQRAGLAPDAVRAELGWAELHVPPLDGPQDPERYAPSGHSPEGLRLQGQVHDDNCRRAGGQNTGHAGWFGSLNGVLQAAGAWQDLLAGRPSPLPQGGLQLCVREAELRTPGFDIPTPGGSAGPGWGPRSLGHLGFTGTAFWIDPDRDLLAILLSNRTWPDGQDRGILELRQAFFSWASRQA